MFVAWGPELTLLYNDEYAKVLGAKHPDALGQPFASVWRDIWPQFEPIVKGVLTGEAVAFHDLLIPMRRNNYPEDTWFSFSYTPLHDESGEIAGLFCACIETTAKVRSEQALREHEAHLEELVAERTVELNRVWQNSRDLLVVVGTDGIFRAVNPAWTSILGHRADEVVGQHVLNFVWPDDASSTQAALARAVDQDLNDFENRYRHQDGTFRWISWRTSVEGGLVYAYGRHITHEKEQAATLQRVEEQLRQAQKMEAVGQLTGGLAHDFNNLLLSISGSLELLKMRVTQGRIGDLDRYLTAALGAKDRAAALTHRLLAFSRRQTLDPKPTSMNPLIVGMEELIRGTVGPEIRIETTLEAGVWPVMCDPHQLENALLNLCINARDAMPDGGQLNLKTSNVWLNEQEARACGLVAGQYVAICVGDTGAGMTPEVKARAFDPFFTTKPTGMGTGLGLSMVHGFVNQSGGQVQIRSRPGEGATICIYLPRHWGEADSLARRTGSDELPKAPARRTVLVVDDEPAVRMLVSEVLNEMGYAVLEAAGGASGLKLLQSDAVIDLLISDIGLPGGMNGRQMTDAGRHVRPELKVLFITGYAEQTVFGNGQMEPWMHVMTKPFTIEALASRIKAITT
jgi:PAS domain S-box-containing protein